MSCATSWCRSIASIRSRELLEACRNYPTLSNARRITFEYVMLKGVNDSLAEARELVRLLAGIPAKINLIPFNPWPGAPYECSDWEQIERFAEVVNKAGYASPVRTPRGRDIHAACGQLKSASVKQRASAVVRSMRRRAAAGSNATCSGRPPAASSSSSRSRCCWRRRPRASCSSRWAWNASPSFLHVNPIGNEDAETIFAMMNQGFVLAASITVIPALLMVIVGEIARIRVARLLRGRRRPRARRHSAAGALWAGRRRRLAGRAGVAGVRHGGLCRRLRLLADRRPQRLRLVLLSSSRMARATPCFDWLRRRAIGCVGPTPRSHRASGELGPRAIKPRMTPRGHQWRRALAVLGRRGVFH